MVRGEVLPPSLPALWEQQGSDQEAPHFSPSSPQCPPPLCTLQPSSWRWLLPSPLYPNPFPFLCVLLGHSFQGGDRQYTHPMNSTTGTHTLEIVTAKGDERCEGYCWEPSYQRDAMRGGEGTRPAGELFSWQRGEHVQRASGWGGHARTCPEIVGVRSRPEHPETSGWGVTLTSNH